MKDVLSVWFVNLFWFVLASLFMVSEAVATATEKQTVIPDSLKETFAANNMVLVQQTPFWVESFTLIVIALITAVVAPVTTMWARKKFAVEPSKGDS
jgi:hypothetical protein